MRHHGLTFDHNLHALRIVEDFEQRYAAFRGLNLTFEVREGIIKHSRSYNASEYPELAEYLLDQQPPLEAQLIDATDELAYNTADLDDGFEAHLLTLDQIKQGVPVFARFFSEVERLYPDAAEKLQFNEVIRRMLDRWVGDLIENTRAEISSVGAEFQSRPGACVTVADIRACPRRLITLSPETEAERRQTKAFLHEQVYFSAALDPEKEAAERIITDLFELWMKHPEKLPESYQEKAEAEPLARVVCDYVAGMTDTYIYEQYEKHCG
jgi:dGTPase